MTFGTFDRLLFRCGHDLMVLFTDHVSQDLQLAGEETDDHHPPRRGVRIGGPTGGIQGTLQTPTLSSHVPYHLRLLWITDCVLNSVLTRATKRKACPQEGGNGTCCLDNKHTRVHFCRKSRGDCFSSHVFTQDFCPRGNHSNKCSWVVHKIFNLSSGRGSDLHVDKCFDMNEKCVWMTVKSYSV